VIALISPPNTNDSLSYHLARVAHWAQNANLRHYPTAYEFQLYNAIWAELVILHTYVLSASDQLANLVQWLSMVGCVFLGIEISGKLGLSFRGKLITGSLILTIPSGILQATSTQNDYVTAFWLMVLLLIVFMVREVEVGLGHGVLIGGAVGLGMLTKGTYYPYAFPILLWIFIPILWNQGIKKTLRVAATGAIVAIFLNGAFWIRNLTTYRSIIGPEWWINEKSLGTYSVQSILANMVRQTSIHFGSPFLEVNEQISSAVISFCEFLGQTECVVLRESPQYTYRIPLLSNHEDSVGNLIHMVIVLIALVCIPFLVRKWKYPRTIIVYSLVLISAFIGLSASIMWELFGNRYQLPFFLLAAPICSFFIIRSLNRRMILPIALGLFLLSSPWLLFNRTRPLIGLTPRITMVNSIFAATRTDLYFANHDWLKESLITLGNKYRAIDCDRVGLWIDSRDPEYLFWVQIDHKDRKIQIENLNYDPLLEKYSDESFEPCAIVCSICGGKSDILGLPLVYRSKGLDLYLEPTYQFP
jgi:hypothetical protein